VSGLEVAYNTSQAPCALRQADVHEDTLYKVCCIQLHCSSCPPPLYGAVCTVQHLHVPACWGELQSLAACVLVVPPCCQVALPFGFVAFFYATLRSSCVVHARKIAKGLRVNPNCKTGTLTGDAACLLCMLGAVSFHMHFKQDGACRLVPEAACSVCELHACCCR
jgi:hypothetical protein